MSIDIINGEIRLVGFNQFSNLSASIISEETFESEIVTEDSGIYVDVFQIIESETSLNDHLFSEAYTRNGDSCDPTETTEVELVKE